MHDVLFGLFTQYGPELVSVHPFLQTYMYFLFGLSFSIVLERYFRYEISLLSILCMLIARMEMETSRVSGDSDIIT